MTISKIEEFWETLDREDDEPAVRQRIAAGAYRQPRREWAERWLENRKRKADLTVAERQELRESEALDLSRAANRYSKWSNWIAGGALILSAIALYFSVH
jgi:hypothetical protein